MTYSDQVFGEGKAPLQESTTQYANPITVCPVKRGQDGDRVYDERAKKPKISQENLELDSINLSSILLLPNSGIQIDPRHSFTISEEQPTAGFQATSILELKALEESVLSAFEYSDNVVVLGENKFPVPMGSEINSFLKFKRTHLDLGGRARVIKYPQRAMPACWNAAVQNPSDRILLAFCTLYIDGCIRSVHCGDK